MASRVGFGFDSHRLVAGRPLIVGGVQIEHDRGLDGHSDADVLAHAIIDALLGAAALGDVGSHFPPDQQRWQGADSIELLQKVVAMLEEGRWRIENIDSTIVAQAPKLAGHRDAMRGRIAAACRIERQQVSVKATTAEGMGLIGAGEGMAAYAIAAISGREPEKP